jgi:hypothetical protein
MTTGGAEGGDAARVWSAGELHRQHPFISGPRTGAACRAGSGAKSLLLARLEIQRCHTVPSRSGRRKSRAGRGRAQRAVMALRRDPSWLCGGRRQMERITSRESDVQEPRAKRADRGRQDSHGGGQRRKRETLLHQNAQCQSGRAGLATQERSATQQQSPHSSVATHSTVIPHAGRCVVVVVL